MISWRLHGWRELKWNRFSNCCWQVSVLCSSGGESVDYTGSQAGVSYSDDIIRACVVSSRFCLSWFNPFVTICSSWHIV